MPVTAHRTSPTNIGLYLLSIVSAHEMGWIGSGEARDRISGTLATLRRLETYRGHLFNWYDTRTLAPLEPRYVSTVDSGNLAAHLLAVANALEAWREEVPHPSAGVEALVEMLEVLHASLVLCGRPAKSARLACDVVRNHVDRLEETMDGSGIRPRSNPASAVMSKRSSAILTGSLRMIGSASLMTPVTGCPALRGHWTPMGKRGGRTSRNPRTSQESTAISLGSAGRSPMA